jgi:hypothetical protein
LIINFHPVIVEINASQDWNGIKQIKSVYRIARDGQASASASDHDEIRVKGWTNNSIVFVLVERFSCLPVHNGYMYLLKMLLTTMMTRSSSVGDNQRLNNTSNESM